MAKTLLGDDCIAIKGNSTNIHIKNIACYGSNGNGIPIGSIGQDPQVPEFVENILIEDVVLYGSDNAAWVKIFSDTTQGHVRNVTWRNFECNNVNLPIAVTQCIYTDDPSSCDSSKVRPSLAAMLMSRLGAPKSSNTKLSARVDANLRPRLGELSRDVTVQCGGGDPLLRFSAV